MKDHGGTAKIPAPYEEGNRASSPRPFREQDLILFVYVLQVAAAWYVINSAELVLSESISDAFADTRISADEFLWMVSLLSVRDHFHFLLEAYHEQSPAG